MEPVYFSRVKFTECMGEMERGSTILLDLVSGELSYQVYRLREYLPIIVDDLGRRVRGVGQGYYFEEKELFTFGIKLSDIEIEEILPYCNALEYERYRGKTMSARDAGYIGYRDEVSVQFAAITDSYIPRLELPMDFYYDDEHAWPHERLYQYIVARYFEKNEALNGYGKTYGIGSLFWGGLFRDDLNAI